MAKDISPLRDASVTILGARGSVPVSGEAYARYGGATSCILVRLASQPVIVDAGTGLLGLRTAERTLPLLLTHPHADHLLGLPMWPMVFDPEAQIDIYAAPLGALETEGQLCALMSPPLWPVGPGALRAALRFHSIQGPFSLGPVQVETMPGRHPGGVTLYRLSGGGKTVTVLTDCTLEGEAFEAAAAFARNCDLLLCDGQYSPEEWPFCKSFGHNCWEAAARLGAESGAGITRVIHHSPYRSDEELERAQAGLEAICPSCAFARAGEEILL